PAPAGADAPATAPVPEAAPSFSGEKAAANTATTARPRRERPLRAPGRTAPAPPPVEARGPARDVATAPATDRSAAPGGLAAMAAAAVAKLAAIGVPALVATGVIMRLGLLRRLQLRRRTPERSLPEPDPGLEPLERRLRAIAADEVVEWVELTLRLLTLRISQAEYEVVPKVVVVRAGEFGIEVLLDQPCSPAPEGFEIDDDARVWRVAADMEVDVVRDLVASAPVISPALVTLGMSPEGPVLVDLETLGVLSVEGDEQRVRSFLAGVALQLATASWSELEVAVLEDDLGVAALERGPSCSDVEELVKRVATSARGTAGALDSLASTTAARVAEADADTWAPVVAVVGPARREEAVDQVVQVLGAPGRGGALVAAGPVRDATWRLSISAAGQAVLSPLGLEVDISAVDSDAVVACSQLLEVAAEEGDNAPLVDLVTESARHQAAVGSPGPVDDSAALGQQRLLEPPGPEDVVVRVLGRPEVIGWDSPAGPKTAEIVAYLAVHDDPVPIERFRDAMWPLGARESSADDDATKVASAWAEPVSQQTVKSALWRARRALGFDAEGRPHLPPTKGGLLGPLGPGVRRDWSEFRALVALSQRQPRHEAMQSLRAALERVRGAPFSYVPEGTHDWAASERIAANIEIAVGDAAHRLCRWALEQGDDELAMWATHQGLLASPGHEALYRDRMEAAAASGDPTRLRKVLSDAQQAVRSIDPLDDLSQETVALYEHLSTKLERRGA
ncbi:MAG: bacterial transcriptional activator domain-containing protein, partial [Actinobacteria bacterium]|nr:bacterial transcriptional activator domain-containing protein [Actinomycetota bacterium]